MAFRLEQDLDMNEEAELIRLENGDASDPAPAFMPAPTGRLRLMQASLLGAAAMPSTARRERIAAAVPPCIYKQLRTHGHCSHLTPHTTHYNAQNSEDTAEDTRVVLLFKMPKGRAGH
eukprot:scaffold1597_cov198-Isochrysis_galbana.AAC.3